MSSDGKGQQSTRLPGGAELNLEKRLSYRFSILSARMIGAVAEMYGPRFSLLPSGWKAMATIGRHGKVSAKEVCAHTTVTPDKITRAVDRLVALGFVERRRDAADGRKVSLSLSSKGAQVYAEIERVTRQLELSLRSVLSAAELAALDRILGKLEWQARTTLSRRDAWHHFAAPEGGVTDGSGSKHEHAVKKVERRRKRAIAPRARRAARIQKGSQGLE